MYKSIFKSVQSLINVHLASLNFVFGKKNKSKRKISENFRGKIEHIRDGNGKLLCNGCGVCRQVCPCKDLIKINSMPSVEGKISVIYETDNSVCTFCGNCVEYCPQKALKFIPWYMQSVTDKNELKTEVKDI